jgi:oxygen-independent coproporphyrinogen-3 oxidase
VLEKYTDALCKQLSSYGPILTDIGYRPKYIYWGGGTPSRLSPEQISRIVSVMNDSFDMATLQQHTMETSPETLSPEKLGAIRSAGIQRISMGVQSFDDHELRRAARSHSAEQACQAVAWIQQAGFEDLNIDLISGLPGQTLETLEKSVNTAIKLDPTHISIYVYRPDPKTVMAKQSYSGKRELVGLEKLKKFYGAAKKHLEQAGYAEYSTYYFAKDSKYHFKAEEYYFEMQGDYIGFGCGAYSILGHRFLKAVSDQHRFMEDPLTFEVCQQYSSFHPEGLTVLLSQAVLTNAGINFKQFERYTGFPFSLVRRHPYVESLLQYYSDCGAVFVETDECLYLTPETRSDAHIAHLSGIYEAARFRATT